MKLQDALFLLWKWVLTFVITFVGVIVSNALTFVNTFFNNSSVVFCPAWSARRAALR
jgi:hypothetical protein